MRLLKYIFAFVLAAGFISYVIYDTYNTLVADDEEKPEHKTTFVLGITNNLSSLPIWIAEEDSIFDSLKVSITIRDYDDQLTCDMAYAEEKLNMAIVDSKRAEWLVSGKHAAMNTLDTLPYRIAMVSNPKSRITKVAQLKDKILAVTRNSCFAAAAHHCIDSIKMKRDSVYIVQINNPNISMKMLQANELDATFLPEPQLSLAKKMGCEVLYEKQEQAYLIQRPDIAHPEEIEAFNKAYQEAMRLIRKHGVAHYSDLIARRCKCSPQFRNVLKEKF
ncbi:MAG: hypothetical protein HUK08_08830 [Bacteroidaceae bacterium]|nr:hypothetical protein [Bacteroidaceae bacterium]